MLGDKISWPWGKAVCQSKLELPRESLAKAMSEAEYEMVMPEQTVRCTLAQKDRRRALCRRGHHGAQGEIRGRQVLEATHQLGRGTAPMFIYPLIYAGTGLDNSTNVLGPEVVRMVNEFTTKKCAR